MPIRYTNAEIRALLKEPKRVDMVAFSFVNWLNREGHKRADIDVEGDDGHFFQVKLRQTLINRLNFSVILGVAEPNTNTLFRLRRYNGKHGWHRNKIEGERFRDFHIHTATERYQDRGFDEDDFAAPTDRYSSFESALRCMIEDCGFYGSEPASPTLFDASP